MTEPNDTAKAGISTVWDEVEARDEALAETRAAQLGGNGPAGLAKRFSADGYATIVELANAAESPDEAAEILRPYIEETLNWTLAGGL